MSMVFNYYAFGTSDMDDILYNLKDKLSENGWIIDYDKISTEGKLAFHVVDTQCYYTIEKNPIYQNLDTGEADSHYHPYNIHGNTGVDTGTWYNPTLGYEGGRKSYFIITNSYCLVNSQFCILILEGRSYHQSDCYHCIFYMFGQLEIPNEDQQGNFLWVTPSYSNYNPGEWSYFGCCPGYQIGVYYKDTFCKPDNIEPDAENYYCRCGRSFYGLLYRYTFYGESCCGNPDCGHCSYYDTRNQLAGLPAQPYQFGRLYLRTLIIYHKYEQDGVTYIHPIAETPFYLCKYRGIEWYNKTITYNTRKFKVFPLVTINFANEFGIAFEVGNL